MSGLWKFLWRIIVSVFRLTPIKKKSIMEINALITKLKQHREKLEARIVYKEREIQQKQEERHARERLILQDGLDHFQKILDEINAILSNLEKKKLSLKINPDLKEAAKTLEDAGKLLVSLNLIEENDELIIDNNDVNFPGIPGHPVGEEDPHPEEPVPRAVDVLLEL